MPNSIKHTAKIIIARQMLEEYSIPFRNSLAICLCNDHQRDLIESLKVVNVSATINSIKSYAGMLIHKCEPEDCFLCH